jgi:hypothetical protein
VRATDVAVSAVIAAAAALGAWLVGVQTAEEVRKAFAWLDPTHVLELAVVLVIVAALVSVQPASEVTRPLTTWLRAGGRSTARAVCSIPTIVALTVVVATVAFVRSSLGAAHTLPTVLGDELLYVDLAKSIAVHGEPLLRGELNIGGSVLYPLFLSPAYALAPNGAAAFAAAKAMNAVAMALAAVPAYFLARRVVSHGWSLVVAVATVTVPWMQYGALTMTEPLFYPVFVAFALALVLALEQPTLRRQLLMLALLAALVGIRPQALAVVGSVVLAVLLRGLLDGALRRTTRAYLVTLVLISVALVAGLAAAAAGVQVPTSGYSAIFNVRYGILGVAKWTTWSLAVYLFALGVVGLVAFPLALVRLLRKDASRTESALGIGSLTLFLGILASVAVLSASPFGLGILHERSLFYVTPVVLVCFAYWLANGLRRPRTATAVVVAASLGAALSLPERIVHRTNNVDSPTSVFLTGLQGVASGVPDRLWLLGVAAAGCAALFLARRPIFLAASVALAFAAVGAAGDIRGPLSARQDRALAWVDHALPSGATATIVHVDLTRPDLPCAEVAEYEEQGLLVWTEFFNTRADRFVHVYGTRGRDGLQAPLLTVGADGTVLDDGKPIEPRYVVVDSRQPIVGARVRRFDLTSIGSSYRDGASLTLWRVTPPLRLLPTANPLPPRGDGRGC